MTQISRSTINKMKRRTKRLSNLIDSGPLEEIEQIIKENCFYHSSKLYSKSSIVEKYINNYDNAPVLYKAIVCFRADVVKLLYENGHRLGKQIMTNSFHSCLWCCGDIKYCDNPLTMTFNIFALMLKANQIDIAKLMILYEEDGLTFTCRSKYGDIDDITTDSMMNEIVDPEIIGLYLIKTGQNVPSELLFYPYLSMKLYNQWRSSVNE
jgi:hypothetical protein